MLLLNILLAIAWLLLTGQFTVVNLFFGLGISFALLWLLGQVWNQANDEDSGPTYFQKVVTVLSFAAFFVKELIVANLRVAADVLRFQPKMEPAVVTIPLHDFTDGEATMLANFVTLTPGTLSLDVSQPNVFGERKLTVHAMHAGRTEAAIERFKVELQQQYANRVQEVMRL